MSMVELLLDPAREGLECGYQPGGPGRSKKVPWLVLNSFPECRSGEDKDGGNCHGVPRLEADEFAGLLDLL
jgi:hypothetical protein